MYGKQNIPQQRKRLAGYRDTVRFPDADVTVGAEVHPPDDPINTTPVHETPIFPTTYIDFAGRADEAYSYPSMLNRSSSSPVRTGPLSGLRGVPTWAQPRPLGVRVVGPEGAAGVAGEPCDSGVRGGMGFE